MMSSVLDSTSIGETNVAAAAWKVTSLFKLYICIEYNT